MMNNVLSACVAVALATLTFSAFSDGQYFNPISFVNGAMGMWPGMGMRFPMPVFKPIVMWYQGPNVCVDEENRPTNEDDIWGDLGGGSMNSQSHSEQCRGDEKMYKCVARIEDNGQTKYRIRTYTCCNGYRRAPPGKPGCVPA